METLRQTILSEAEGLNRKSRFGLFSQPTTIALGDSIFPPKTARKGEDGKPVTKPRNMLPGPNRSGITKRDFLEAPSSIHVGDRYLDPEKVDLLYEQKFHGKSGVHEVHFRPNNSLQTLSGTSYRHIDENPIPKNKPARDETGRVVTKDKNATSNPTSKVEKDYFKNPKYVIDPYERKDLQESQERRLSIQKRGDEVFRTMSHGNILFSNHRQAYGVDSEAEQLLKKKKIFVESAPNTFKHETKFKLARRGFGDPIGRYPEFLQPKLKMQKAVPVRKVKSDKEEWCHVGNRSVSRPTPSISYSAFSLRKYK